MITTLDPATADDALPAHYEVVNGVVVEVARRDFHAVAPPQERHPV